MKAFYDDIDPGKCKTHHFVHPCFTEISKGEEKREVLLIGLESRHLNLIFETNIRVTVDGTRVLPVASRPSIPSDFAYFLVILARYYSVNDFRESVLLSVA